ncbi:MAG: hypothetical protein ACLP1X_18615 [Polyangiaceae bacterium]
MIRKRGVRGGGWILPEAEQRAADLEVEMLREARARAREAEARALAAERASRPAPPPTRPKKRSEPAFTSVTGIETRTHLAKPKKPAPEPEPDPEPDDDVDDDRPVHDPMDPQCKCAECVQKDDEMAKKSKTTRKYGSDAMAMTVEFPPLQAASRETVLGADQIDARQTLIAAGGLPHALGRALSDAELLHVAVANRQALSAGGRR